VPQLIASVADQSPDAIALTAGSLELSYFTLNARANQLAMFLRSLGVGADTLVALCLECSVDYVIATLAVWKTGAAYLPLDPAWPQARTQAIVKDAQPLVLITRNGAPARARYVVDLYLNETAIARELTVFTPSTTRRDHLANIIYPSGTTSRANGVEVTHGNLLNRVFGHRRALNVSPGDRASHVGGIPSDAAMVELWSYLTAGASIALPEESARAFPESLRS
jgi:non-ribosomal peptide synthetase component F